MTKKQLVDDIILRITKGAPSDDLELSPRQVAFWFDLVAKDIVSKYLDAKLKQNKPISSIMIEIDDDRSGTVENEVMIDAYDDRVYITTTKNIIDLPNDNGVLRIITQEGQTVNRVPIERLDSLNKMTFSKPTRDNLLFSKIDQKLYIHGLNPAHVGLVTFSVTYIPKIAIVDLANTDEVKLPDEVVNLISDEVEKKALRQMSGVADIENDAEDDPTNG
ncbi:MAG TPA: hypothetical protein VGD26_10780 [Chitinophagaceae bacterium]